ncbi:MAG: AAA family ATPase [Patescibacteria group bacterium]|nr:AAA family ATPase [Patescibacteria group bacterium]
MPLINKISIKNFKCFRNKIDIPLNQGSYLIGANNAGKTAVLNAINFFFDSSLFFDESFLNRTNYLAKKSGYNKSEITLSFDLSYISNSSLKNKLVKFFSSEMATIKKVIIFSPDSGSINLSYDIKGNNYTYDDLNENVKKMISSVKIVYIHPQEGRELLLNAQNKLRTRLLANWGRNAKLSHSIKDLQDKWSVLRKQAREYLSGSLSNSLQNMWPGGSAYIDLPKEISDIVAISDITFKGNISLPDINLTAQGTGAQTTILYLTHYLLDSDRSLHRGEYHPIWLLEEPESFLHADLIAKFASQLNSESWMSNIQVVVSTHSPILLSVSRMGKNLVSWSLLDNYEPQISKNVIDWSHEEIFNVGKKMGDPNFSVYFSVSQNGPIVFLEDKKDITIDRFKKAGISITSGLGGVSEVVRHISVLISSPRLSSSKIYYIVDGDRGFNNFVNFIDGDPVKSIGGLNKFQLKDLNDVYLLSLPKNRAIEEMFDEYEPYLLSLINQIWDPHTWNFRQKIPSVLSTICASSKKKNINSLGSAQNAIKNSDDVKYMFWKKVEKENLSFSKVFISNLVAILND